jgi:hypothetical protein
MFPIVEGWETTYRNPAVQSPKDRELHFGQEDHIQLFGRDVRKTIMNSGFDLSEFTATEKRYSSVGGETFSKSKCERRIRATFLIWRSFYQQISMANSKCFVSKKRRRG